MKKILRWTSYAVCLLIILALIAAAAIWVLGGQKLASHGAGKPEHLAQPTPAQLADAPRLVAILRCADCHNEGLRGDLFFNEPNVAKIYAPNLTQVASKASDQQLARAIRQGIGVDGRSLVIMPSAAFSRLDDSEVATVIAAIRQLPRIGNPTPPPKVGFLGRLGLLTGKFHTTPEQVAQYSHKLPVDLGPQLARGRHMAASNCAECHGPDLGGGEVEPGLMAPDLTIAGAYDLPSFTKLMRTGVPPGGRKLRVMDVVARNGFSHMTAGEIGDLYAYLQARAQRVTP